MKMPEASIRRAQGDEIQILLVKLVMRKKLVVKLVMVKLVMRKAKSGRLEMGGICKVKSQVSDQVGDEEKLVVKLVMVKLVMRKAKES